MLKYWIDKLLIHIKKIRISKIPTKQKMKNLLGFTLTIILI